MSFLSCVQSPAVVREAIFTGAYLGVIPLMKENLMTKWPETFAERPVTANVVASVGAGLGAAVLTHPFDTVKTKMQANLGEPVYRYCTVQCPLMLTWGSLLTVTVLYSAHSCSPRKACIQVLYNAHSFLGA